MQASLPGRCNRAACRSRSLCVA